MREEGGFSVFDDAENEAELVDEPVDEEFPADGENVDPLLPASSLSPRLPPRELVDGAVLQPLVDIGSGGGDADDDEAEAHREAEAALRTAASPAALAARDSFEVYSDEPPADAQAAQLRGDAAGAGHASMLVNPFSPGAVEEALAALDEPVASMQGVTVEDESAAERLESSLSAARRRPKQGAVLALSGFRYILGKLCGRGAYADIYEAIDEDDADSDGGGGAEGDARQVPAAASAPATLALKVVRPPDAAAVAWEFAVLRRVAQRVPPLERPLFLQARRLHMAGPNCVLVAPFGAHGTLQDAVNASLRAAGRVGCMPESLAAYFTIELLRCLEVLHAAGFIHADVKPDNVLLRNCAAGWDDAWAPGRPGSWRERGLALIDFGRSIDLATHAPGTLFCGDCGTENFRCVEMQTGAPWTFQADTFCALGCVHAMLWGTYMDIDHDADAQRWRRRAPLRRYWHAELWEPFFDALLNVPSCDAQPALADFRASFEAFLAAPERALEVRAQLMELTVLMHEQAAKAA